MKPKCANCEAESTVLWNPPGILPLVYCDACLPHWYKARVAAGEFGAPDDLDEDAPAE